MAVLLIALVRDPIDSPTNLPIENPDFLVVTLGPQDRPNLDLAQLGKTLAANLRSRSRPKNVKSSPHTTDQMPRSSCNIIVGGDRPRGNPTPRKCSTWSCSHALAAGRSPYNHRFNFLTPLAASSGSDTYANSESFNLPFKWAFFDIHEHKLHSPRFSSPATAPLIIAMRNKRMPNEPPTGASPRKRPNHWPCSCS